jgi:hypothetical protein
MSRRSIRRRQLLPATLRSPAERREYLIAFGLVVFLQAGITAALLVCAAQTYRMWKQGIPYVPGEVGRMIPLAMLGGAAIALVATLRSAGRIRALMRIPLQRGDGD